MDSVQSYIQPKPMDAKVTNRRDFSNNLNATIALKVLSGNKMTQEIATKHQLNYFWFFMTSLWLF